MQTMTTTRTLALLALLASAAYAQDKPAAPPPSTAPVAPAPRAREGAWPELPKPITSFGAAVSGDSLYIYGGHIGEAHDHSRENLSEAFVRLDMSKIERGGARWETLPMKQKLQGLAMVAYKGRVIRIGGVEARNEPLAKTDMHSTASVEQFDSATGAWSDLTPLPEPRSSFDAAVAGDLLYVIGGWNLGGDEKSGAWAEKSYVADLSKSPIKWEALPDAPFRQRALAVAATGKRIYAIGGLTPQGKPTSAVRIYDPAAKTWSDGPVFPGKGDHAAFGISAYGIGDTVWASASDGKVFALAEGATEWRDANHTLKSPRFFHRILPTAKGSLLFIGGASRAGHRADIESVDLALLSARPLEALPAAPAPGAKTSAVGQSRWPGFRGAGDSHSSAKALPLTWSDSEALAWTVPLGGYGQSSPIVWDGRIFVTSAEGAEKTTLAVRCLDLSTGAERWTKRVDSSAPQALNDYTSKSAPTPVVDGERIVALFESGDLLAVDHEGKTLWQRSLTKEFGPVKGNHGLGSSLAQSGDAVFVLIDHDGPSRLLALDKRDGSTRWTLDRPQRVSWTTPLYVEHAGSAQLILSAPGAVEAISAKNGSALWQFTDVKSNTVPSPTLAGDRIIISGTERGSCLAIRLGGSGDVTGTHLAWRADGATSSFGSPLVAGNSVYFVNKAGVAFCHDVTTGAQRFSIRLPDSCWTSPIAAGDALYFFSKNGATTVLRETAEGPQKLAENKLTIEGRVYGVAAIDGAFILRTGTQLFRVGRPPATAAR
jgi:outer membrane protein assembly factor BamB